jgi:hypothetical protein
MATGLLNFTPINQYSQGDVNNTQDQYGQSQGAYNNAQSGLQDFQKNMTSGTDMYAQQQQAGNQWAGYDPARLQSALKNVQQTQNVISGLPQTINAQNANYGATAGNLAGEYSGMMNNLNPALAAQTNQVAQQQATQQAAGQYAQNATTAGVATQAQKLTGLQNIAQNSLTQMDQARQVMQNMEALYQSQGQFNSSQQAAYEQANAAYISASAQANLAATQAKQIQQQIDQLNAAATPAGQAAAQQATALANHQKASQAYLNGSGPSQQFAPTSNLNGLYNGVSSLWGGLNNGVSTLISHIPGIGRLGA